MLLRVMLVGMVTSLGLELPTENDVDSWSQAGRDWCQARLAEWDAPPALAMMPDDANAFAPDRPELAAEVPNPVEAGRDLAFAAVMDETVNAFAAEQLAEAAALAFANLPEAVEVEDAIDPAVALKLEAAALANFPRGQGRRSCDRPGRRFGAGSRRRTPGRGRLGRGRNRRGTRRCDRRRGRNPVVESGRSPGGGRAADLAGGPGLGEPAAKLDGLAAQPLIPVDLVAHENRPRLPSSGSWADRRPGVGPVRRAGRPFLGAPTGLNCPSRGRRGPGPTRGARRGDSRGSGRRSTPRRGWGRACPTGP